MYNILLSCYLHERETLNRHLAVKNTEVAKKFEHVIAGLVDAGFAYSCIGPL